jgi:aspartate carbamoyltransferase catalytic subunit
MTNLDAALEGVDAVVMLRVQFERAAGGSVSSDYRSMYGLTQERAARMPAHALIMHPGPINRGLEIDDGVADDPVHSRILRQVTIGVAARMAVLENLLSAESVLQGVSP